MTSAPAKPIRLAVVDDHNMFRTGISSLLQDNKQFQVDWLACNGRDMQDKLRRAEDSPDVILMDINMPLMDGFQSTAWVCEHHPLTRVLALTMNDDERSIIRMIRSGACGFILKESDVQELENAITVIHETGIYLNDLVTKRLLRRIEKEAPEEMEETNTALQDYHITPKEREFLSCIASDLTYKEMAEKLGISPRTLENYRESLFQKLQVKSRIGLVMLALKTGLIRI